MIKQPVDAHETPAQRSADAPLTEITLPTIDGGTLRFRDLRGKYVLLFCWASW